MKIAFSTLGCPDWTFGEMMSTAKDLNFDAIEIRGIENEVFAPYAKPFIKRNLSNTIKLLGDKKIEISLLATGVSVGQTSHIESAFGEATVYTDLAEKLGVKFIRVMITNKPQPEDTDFEGAVIAYQRICDYAKESGITPLIETNGILADSKRMREFIKKTNRQNSGVLWDIHHPYRFFNEPAHETFNNIGEFVKYVHVKDSVMKDGEVLYKMIGQGDVPIADSIRLLKENNYNSFITLEWVKRWCPELEDAGIVFSHFINYMDNIK